MATDPLEAIRDIALALPEAVEQATPASSTFRVGKKIFVSFGVDDDGRTALTVKAAPGAQESLLADGEPYFLPPYIGTKGWIGLHVGPDTDWREVEDLVVDSYREIAPRTLSASIGLRPGTRGPGARAIVGVGNVIGELVEGKPPKDQTVIEQQVDDDHDDGLVFDEDDPRGTTIEL